MPRPPRFRTGARERRHGLRILTGSGSRRRGRESGPNGKIHGMRCAERFLLLLLLSVSLDFAATAVPTPSGFHWDDEEEAVQWRRSARISPTSSPGGSANPAAIAVFPARPRPPVPDRGRQQRRA